METQRTNTIHNHTQTKPKTLTRLALMGAGGGAKPSKAQKLKGSSLMEVVAALSIIAIIFAIASQIWTQGVIMSAPEQLFKQRLELRALLAEPYELENMALPYQEESPKNGLTYSKEWKEYPTNPNLVQVRVACYRNEQLLVERFKLIPR